MPIARHGLVCCLPTYRIAYRCIMLDRTSTCWRRRGHKWKLAAVECDEDEYIRKVLGVSWMLVEKSRFDWMALSRI
jgi:hypothetical protein